MKWIIYAAVWFVGLCGGGLLQSTMSDRRVTQQQRQELTKAFDAGCLAGMQAGIDRYTKTLLRQTSDAERANIVNVIFSDIKTNSMTSIVWAQYHGTK